MRNQSIYETRRNRVFRYINGAGRDAVPALSLFLHGNRRAGQEKNTREMDPFPETACIKITKKAERFAVKTYHFRIQHQTHTTAARVLRAHKTSPQGTMTKRQPGIGTSRSAGVGWSGLVIALGSGWPTGIKTQTKRQNQPTGYFLL